MTGFVALLFALLGVLNTWIGRSPLYPAALFCFAWSAYASAVGLSPRFFPVSEELWVLFLAGAVALSCGAGVALLMRGRHRPVAPVRGERAVSRLLNMGFWLVIATLPIRLLRLRELSAGQAFEPLSSAFWIGIRRATILESEEGRLSLLGLSDNLLLIALFTALAAVERDVRRRRLGGITIPLVTLALFYQISTASRSSAMALVCGLIGMAWLASGRSSLRNLAMGGVGVLLVFCVAGIAVNRGGDVGESLGDAVDAVAGLASLYGVGPIVALDRALSHPAEIPPAWSIGYSFIQVANKLGAQIELPSLHAEYVQVSDDEWMNVYTIYFAYIPEFGMAGAVALLFAIGGALGWLFASASDGDPRARLVYALAISPILMTGFNEQFFMVASTYAKAAVFAFALYGAPLRRDRLPIARSAPARAGARAS